MSRLRSADFETCERCGAYLLRELTCFHQCKGSQTWLRPANVSPERWNAALAALVATPPKSVPTPVPAEQPARRPWWQFWKRTA